MSAENENSSKILSLVSMSLISLATGVWDTLGESAFALCGMMGDDILKTLEKDSGLELAGEDPKAVVEQVAAVLVKEYGFASEIQAELVDSQKITLRVRDSVNAAFSEALAAKGVARDFTCPIMNACASALKRIGFRARQDIQRWPEGSGSIITYTKM